MGNKDNNDRNRPKPPPMTCGFTQADRDQISRLLGLEQHMHNVEHQILDAIAAAQTAILAAIAAQSNGDTSASKLSVNLGQPAEKP